MCSDPRQSWKRLEPDEQTCQELGIKHFKIVGNYIPDSAIDEIANIASAHDQINLSISCNTLHSFTTLAKLMALTRHHPNIQIKSLDFYEDGSIDCLRIFTNNPTRLSAALHNLKKAVNGEVFPVDHGVLTLYNWHHIFKGRVRFKTLRPECYSKFSKNAYLRNYLGSSLSRINWDRFSHLTPSQQDQFLRAVKFNRTELQQLYDRSKGENVVFTGTTSWSNYLAKSRIATQQTEVLKNINNPASQYFLPGRPDVFFKGHPDGGVINKITITALNGDVTILNDRLSLEILMMTDMLPDKVFGMLGSAYFTLPREKIGFLVYHRPSLKKPDRNAALDDNLVHVRLELGLVTPEQIVT